MTTKTEQVDEQFDVKRYRVQYPISAYTFPHEARIRRVRFDEEYLHMELIDGRLVSVPLRWIPTLYRASVEDREKYEFDRSRTMIVWDPDKCAINDEVRVADYLRSYP
jgi:hypothetical protein